MLLKVKLGDVQKFVRITEPNLTEFLSAGKKLGYLNPQCDTQVIHWVELWLHLLYCRQQLFKIK